jgi:hypothetical protein
MQAIDERHVIPDYLRHRCKQMARLHHDVDRLLGVADSIANGQLSSAASSSNFSITLWMSCSTIAQSRHQIRSFQPTRL